MHTIIVGHMTLKERQGAVVKSAFNKQQQRTVKPVTQIAAQLRASFASRCAGRYVLRLVLKEQVCQ